MAFSEGNQLFASDSHVPPDEINAGMLQFTMTWNWKWIVQHRGYLCRKLPAAMSVPHQSLCIFKAGLSSLSDGWAKYKQKVPDMSDSNQNLETICNSKLKFSEFKDFLNTGQK